MTEVVKRDKSVDIWGVNDLKKLTKEELVYRYEQVHNQYVLYKWRILLEIRRRFKSNIEFGRYLRELKEDPEYPVDFGLAQQISECIQAAKFCERHKISDLNKSGLGAQVIKELARPINAPIADQVLLEIRRKNVTVKTAKYLLSEALQERERSQAITVEPQEEKKLLEADREPTEPYVVRVEKGIVIEPSVVALEPEAAERAVNSLMQTLIGEEDDHNDVIEVKQGGEFADDVEAFVEFVNGRDKQQPHRNVAMLKELKKYIDERIDSILSAMYPKR